MADLDVIDVMERTAGLTSGGRTSPAAHLAEEFAAAEVTGPRGVSLRELPFRTLVGLRATPGTPGGDALAAALGAPLPERCGTVSRAEGVSVLYLSPDEFLAVRDAEPAVAVPALEAALGDAAGAVVDLSANRTTLELSGPSARAVLEKGCSLDLHPRASPTGNAYVTLVGPVPVILWKVGDEAYQVLPRSSYADFLGRWLLDAMAEFAAPPIP